MREYLNKILNGDDLTLDEVAAAVEAVALNQA